MQLQLTQEPQNNTTFFPEPDQRPGTKVDKHETKLHQETYSQHDLGNLFETRTERSRRQEEEESLSKYDQREGVQWKENTQLHKNDNKNNRTTKTRIVEARNETKRTEPWYLEFWAIANNWNGSEKTLVNIEDLWDRAQKNRTIVPTYLST